MRELLRISAEMKRSRPVFIVGEARSGTSILYRTLQKHSAFRPATPNLVETQIFADLRRTFMFRPGYPIRSCGHARRRRGVPAVPRVVSALLIPVNLVVKDRSGAFGSRTSTCSSSAATSSTRRSPAAVAGLSRRRRRTPRTWQACRVLPARAVPVHPPPPGRRLRLVLPAGGGRSRRAMGGGARRRGLLPELRRVDRARARWRERNGNLLMVAHESFTSSPASEFAAVCAFLDEPVEADVVREEHPDPGR